MRNKDFDNVHFADINPEYIAVMDVTQGSTVAVEVGLAVFAFGQKRADGFANRLVKSFVFG